MARLQPVESQALSVTHRAGGIVGDSGVKGGRGRGRGRWSRSLGWVVRRGGSGAGLGARGHLL